MSIFALWKRLTRQLLIQLEILAKTFKKAISALNQQGPIKFSDITDM